MRRRLALLALGAIFLAILVFFPREKFLDLKSFIQSQETLGPVVFVLVYVACAILWIPSSLLTLFGGAVFGVLWGVIWVTLGANLGSIAAFAVARYLAGTSVTRRLRARFPRVESEIRDQGFYWVLGLRLFPAMPFVVFNYLCGASGVRWRPYVAGTFLGMIPGTLVYVVAGSVAGDLGGGVAADDWRLLGALALLAVLVIALPLAKKLWKSPRR